MRMFIQTAKKPWMVRRKHVYITEVFCFLNLSTAQVAARLLLQQWFVIHYEISAKSG
jgi:hypothetical protein